MSTADAPLRILIAEDQAMLRGALTALLVTQVVLFLLGAISIVAVLKIALA